jgi:uncharacterized protein YecT (DUF1311 family)
MLLKSFAKWAITVLVIIVAQHSSAWALTMQECAQKYKEAQSAGILNGLAWNDFRMRQCDLGAAAPRGSAATSTAPKPAAPAKSGAVTPQEGRPSFDCSKAKSAAARLICFDSELAKLDGQLGVAFQQVRSNLDGADRENFVQEQLTWIRDRNKNCNLVGKENVSVEELAKFKSCVKASIERRIAELAGPVPNTSGDQVLATETKQNIEPGQELDPEEISAFRLSVSSHWSPPPGTPSNIYVVLRVKLNRDGSLAGDPILKEAPPSPMGPPLAQSAKQAIIASAPYKMFKPSHYESWKDIDFRFDPSQKLTSGADARVVEQARQQQAERQRQAINLELASHPVDVSGPLSNEVYECVREMFPKMGFSAPLIKGSPCSDYMGVYSIETTDSREIPGGVEVLTKITLKATQPIAADSFIAGACYGGTRNPLAPGDNVVVQTRIQFEKWNSGLRCISQHF